MRFCLGATAVVLVACSNRLPHPPYVQHPTTALVEVQFPPPPARAESVPKKPTAGAVWIDGEWTWRRKKWAWSPGMWVLVPSGSTYSPWTTVRDVEGTLFHAPGTWRNAKGDEIPAPSGLAFGEAPSGAMIDPEGEMEHPGRNIRPERPLRRAADGGS